MAGWKGHKQQLSFGLDQGWTPAASEHGSGNGNGNGQLSFSAALDRIPPQSLDAEQAVLGCLIIDPGSESLDTARFLLRPEMYYREAHRLIYESILALDDDHEPVDLLTLAEHLELHGKLEVVGGKPYLIACQHAVPGVSKCASYCHRVKRAFLDRSIIAYGGDAVGLGYDSEVDPDEKIANLYSRVVDLGNDGTTPGLEHVAGTAAEAWERIEIASQNDTHLAGLSTGWKQLDYMTAGLQASDLIVIAGRPGSGKTLSAVALAEHVADQGAQAAIFSLEMKRLHLIFRMLATESGVDSMRLRTGWLKSGYTLPSGEETPDEWVTVAQAIARVSERSIYIDDSSSLTTPEIRARARRLKTTQGLGLVIIDYLQLVRSHRKAQTRHDEITGITRDLKAMARDLDVPVIALSQLSRAVERGEDKRPKNYQLLESGSIESEADVILMVYRPGAYEQSSEATLEKQYGEGGEGGEPLELIVTKNRNGATGTVHLRVNLRLGRFYESDYAHA